MIESAQQFTKTADRLCNITGNTLCFESLWCIVLNKLVSFLHDSQDLETNSLFNLQAHRKHFNSYPFVAM